jgi:ribA/ribD-fused uncharacterized protein
MKKTDKFTFFWKSNECFSNWYMSDFTNDLPNKIKYNCSEQCFMHQKALLFGDEDVAKQILKTKHPRDQKVLGRTVKNFDASLWELMAKKLMYEVNKLKFTQNPELFKQLIDTGNTLIVEASPFDKIWGIGMDENHKNVENKSLWLGTNWLGEVLTQLREDLKNK